MIPKKRQNRSRWEGPARLAGCQQWADKVLADWPQAGGCPGREALDAVAAAPEAAMLRRVKRGALRVA